MQHIYSSHMSTLPLSITTNDKQYIGETKIYNTGLKEDPIIGCKDGKGNQSLNSSQWIAELAIFIEENLEELKIVLKTCGSEDALFYFNQANFWFMQAEMKRLASEVSKDQLLLASWFAAIGMEMDAYPYSKHSAAEKEKAFSVLKKDYQDAKKCEVLLKLVTPCRVDLIPRIALERLSLHQELYLRACVARKCEEKATSWKRRGFIVSTRVNSIKRHFDGIYSKDLSEDHAAHLLWNLMAVFHVAFYLSPEWNDL